MIYGVKRHCIKPRKTTISYLGEMDLLPHMQNIKEQNAVSVVTSGH